MNITDDFPIGTKIIIEVVPNKTDECQCKNCFCYKNADCAAIKCVACWRKDDNDILFKVVEVKKP